MSDSSSLPLAELITATGTLGAAAFAVVEGAKKNLLWVGSQGWEHIKKGMGPALYGALSEAYGNNCDLMIRQQFINPDEEMLRHTLRQGFRLGITSQNAAKLSQELGVGRGLVEIASKVQSGASLTDDEKNILAQFELAADARVDGALARARQCYQGRMQLMAMLVALVCAIGTGLYLHCTGQGGGNILLFAILVGIAAVPLAPIYKDLSSAINSAAKVLRGRAS